jgi:hypothetical protein
MKARDLAALAALGIAGKYAYDKYSEKNEPKKKMGEGLDMTNQGAYERATRPEPDEVEVPRYARDRVDRTAELEAEYGPKGSGGMRPSDVGQGGSQVAAIDGYKKLKAAGANSKTPAAAAAPAAAEVVSVPKTRAFTPPGVQSSMGAFTQAGQADEIIPTTRAFTPPGYVASANDYNRASTANTPNNAALGDFTRAVNPAMQADRMAAAASPSARMTDKLAVTSRANQAAYLAQQRAEQARLDALRASGGRRAKGGVIKMASGGLASYKMSKPSGASRGDGIAQRGRTRGKYL